MADRFYGVDREDLTIPPHVTIDSTTTAKEIELRVGVVAGLTAKDVAVALERIRDAVLQDTGRTKL